MTQYDPVAKALKDVNRELERLRSFEVPLKKAALIGLTAPLTSTSWDGDAYSTTAKTMIDLSAVFGVPDKISAVLIKCACRDSASVANNALFVALSPNNTAGEAPLTVRPSGLPNDYFADQLGVVPCDANGDIYYQIGASGAGTMDVYLQIWGYWSAGGWILTSAAYNYIFGTPPNYAQFSSVDGTLRWYGDGTTWRDELYQLIGQRLESPGSDIVQDNAEGAIYFKTSATLVDYVTMSIQINHDWKIGSIVYPHLHWWQTSATLPNWLIQYRWQANGSAKTAAWTNRARISDGFVYGAGTLNQISQFNTITPPGGAGLSDILQIRLIRDTANASGLFGGLDGLVASVYAVSLDVHIEIDAIGSASEYSK